MKQETVRLAEVEVEYEAKVGSATHRPTDASPIFVVQLPEGAKVSVPAGFDADEVFVLLLAVREALR